MHVQTFVRVQDQFCIPVTPKTSFDKGFQAIIILILIINRTQPKM